MSYRTAPAPEPPPLPPCLGCFHPEHRGVCPTCHSRCLATRVCGRLPNALVAHAITLVVLSALSETFRLFAMWRLPVLVFAWLFVTWARRRGWLDENDDATLVRVNLESEPHACGAPSYEALDEAEDYSSSRRSAASSRTLA